ncbi:MAG: exosortase A, partial [Gammaproteobacteria bacterium]
MDKTPTAPGWNVVMPALGLLLLLLLVLYRDTTLYLGGLWSQWRDGGYSHGFIVLLLSVYIIYSARDTLARMVPCPCLYALPVIAMSALAWFVARIADIQLVQTVVLLPLIMSVLWAVTGTRIALQLLLPILFLALAFPVWSSLSPLLQYVSAEGAFWLTRLFGIPAFLQDFIIHLPSGQLSIESACSGLHYLLAGMTLGVFYAWLNYRHLWHRILVVAVAAGASIFANVLRVFLVTWLAYRTDMQHPYINDHLVLGWYLFGGLVFLLLVIDLLLGRHVIGEENRPVAIEGVDCKHDGGRRYAIYFMAALLVASGPLAARWVTGQVPPVDEQLLQLPGDRSGWLGQADASDSWQPVYRGAIPLRGIYRKDGGSVHLFVGYYPHQTQGAELINELNRIANKESWQVSRTAIIGPEQGSPDMIEAELESLYANQRLVWYRYRVAGRYTTSAYVAKLLQVAGLLSGKADASIIAVATDMHNDIRAARERLADFVVSMDEPLARIADGYN